MARVSGEERLTVFEPGWVRLSPGQWPLDCLLSLWTRSKGKERNDQSLSSHPSKCPVWWITASRCLALVAASWTPGHCFSWSSFTDLELNCLSSERIACNWHSPLLLLTLTTLHLFACTSESFSLTVFLLPRIKVPIDFSPLYTPLHTCKHTGSVWTLPFRCRDLWNVNPSSGKDK